MYLYFVDILISGNIFNFKERLIKYAVLLIMYFPQSYVRRTLMPLITISYGIGTEGHDIARKVADDLNMDLYDDQKFQEMVVEHKIRAEEVKELDEKEPGFFDRLFSRKPEIFLSIMDSVVFVIAQKGEGVIIGHGSQTLLQNFGCAMHVLIHNKMENRVQHLLKNQEMSRKAAEKTIHRSDSTQKGFFSFAYQREWNDPSLYDMVLNTEKMGNKLTAKIIVEATQSEAMKECSLAAVDTMKRLALAKKIEAELMKNHLFVYNLNIEVLANGVVNITGTAITQERKERVLRVVKEVQGVSDVNMALFVRSTSW